jgi:hypothetical protein
VLRIIVISAALGIIFLRGLFPIENILSLVPRERLTASVVPADVAELTNEARIQYGIPPLTVNPLLTEAAQLKANDMARGSYYAHISPDGRSPLYWLNLVGYSYLNAGENLVIDRDTAEGALGAWMASPEHRENILRPQFTEIGIGVAAGEYDGIPTIFTVQEFGTPYPLSAPANISAPPKIAEPHRNDAPKAVSKPIAAKSVTQKIDMTSTTSLRQVASSTISFALAPAFFQPTTELATLVPKSRVPRPLAPDAAPPSRLTRVLQKIRLLFSAEHL